MRQTSLLAETWIEVKDGNDTGRSIFDGHYSRRHYRDGRKPKLYVGPGEKLVLISPDALALLIWRKFIDDCSIPQTGINCAVFRNEGTQLSSDLVREADRIAWVRWPEERRHYTYVDPFKTVWKRQPGWCFLKAGWRDTGQRTKANHHILEIVRDA
jgi:hypothetical protein